MVTEGPAEVLHGRRNERESLELLLQAVRGGQSRVLVISGEAGVGKTALLQSLIVSSTGFRTMRAVGVESEMELASRRCISCAHRCSTVWTSSLSRSGTRWTWPSG